MIAIGEAARQSGVHVETIRYYEREGLIAPPGRTASGRRVFTPEEVARLRFIKRCRGLGFSTADIRILIGLTDTGQASCAEVAALGKAQLAEVRARQRHLAELETALQELLAQCDTGRTACPMLEKLLTA